MKRAPRSSHWQSLDIAQMHLWPNAPRRWTLAVIGVVCLGLLAMVLLPKWLEPLHENQRNITRMQAQILNARQSLVTMPPAFSNGPMRPVASHQEAAWMVELAQLARTHQLEHVQIQLLGQSSSASANYDLLDIAFQRAVQRVQLPEGYSDSVVSSMQQQIGWLSVSVVGDYAHLIEFAQALGQRPEWLVVGEAHLKATDNQQVQWQVQLGYYRQAQVSKDHQASGGAP